MISFPKPRNNSNQITESKTEICCHIFTVFGKIVVDNVEKNDWEKSFAFKTESATEKDFFQLTI